MDRNNGLALLSRADRFFCQSIALITHRKRLSPARKASIRRLVQQQHGGHAARITRARLRRLFGTR